MNTELVTDLQPDISPADYYRFVRSQIEHEDNLNSQRLSWFVASQSFLFTAYAIVVSNIGSAARPEWVQRQQHLMTILIPIVSLMTCLLIYLTILAGAIAILNLRKLYGTHSRKPGYDRMPPVQGYRLTQVFGQAGPLFLPPVFIAVWLILLTFI